MTGGARSVKRGYALVQTEFSAELGDIDVPDIGVDEPAGFVVVFVGSLDAAVVVDAGDYLDAGVAQASSEAAGTAEKVNGLYHGCACVGA